MSTSVRWARSPAADSRSDAHWDALLVCVAVLIVTSVGRLHQLFPILLPLKPTLVSGVLALVLYFGDSRGPRQLGGLGSRVTWWAVALLIWAALSVPGALWPGGSFALLTDDLIKTLMMYVVIAGAVRGVRDVERLAFVYFLAAATFSAVGLARFGVGNGARLDHLPYYDANDFGVFAVTAIPLGVYFAVSQSRFLPKLAAVAGLGPLLLAFVSAGSRGGFLALIAVAAFFLVRQNTIATRWRVLGILTIAALVGAVANDSYWERMRTIVHTEKDYNSTSQTGRLQIWSRGIGYMLQNPVFGVGLDNFSTAEGRLSGIRYWTAPHNAYVQIGAELGVPGLLCLLGVIGATLGTLRTVDRTRVAPGAPHAARRLGQALTGAVIGYVVGAFFLSLAYAGMLWALAALAAGLGKVVLTGRPLTRRRLFRYLAQWPSRSPAVGAPAQASPHHWTRGGG
jgi:O-antigen ligase